MCKQLVVLEDVHFSYQTQFGREVLAGVSLELAPGERVALLGASGSGKSTLLSLIGLLNVPDQGTILFEGTDLSKTTEATRNAMRATRVGFVFQHHFLLPELTAVENVALAARLALPYGPTRSDDIEERSHALLVRLGLAERALAFPRQLSGGEQQRVALARALINEPALLLADEPTGNLDSTAGDAVLELLSELQREQGTTLLMATHDQHVSQSCQRQLVIRDGCLVE